MAGGGIKSLPDVPPRHFGIKGINFPWSEDVLQHALNGGPVVLRVLAIDDHGSEVGNSQHDVAQVLTRGN